MPTTPADVREKLVEALGLDLIGPDRDDSHHDEILSQPPARWYLTGFLVPQNAPEPQRCDDNGPETIDQETGNGAGDDDSTPEPPAARRAFFPSSLGLSFLVPKAAKELRVTVRWGDYFCLTPLEEAALPEQEGAEVKAAAPAKGDLWQRKNRQVEVTLRLQGEGKPTEHLIPDSGGLVLVLSIRMVHTTEAMELHLPKGSRSVSVFLVNRRDPRPDSRRDEGFVFQGALDVRADTPFVARPNLRGLATDDRDECIADLQYADVCEYAVGHGVATRTTLDPDCHCRLVETRWIPSAEVERVAPADIPGIELQMETLAKLTDASEAKTKLSGLVTSYRAWIAGQRGKIPDQPKQRHTTALDLLHQAGVAAGRIEAGIALLEQPDIFEAFRMANKCMAMAARQREGVLQGKEPDAVSAPAWRPFQLAFLLMNLRGLADPGHEERLAVDLLFFPTGGGKTEAYLGLAAFALVLRRLRDPGPMSSGVCVLMRYTLRLLTLDQLGRAATLICALELERQQDVMKLGKWPFEIGLWVGRAATPNVMGKKRDNNDESARQRTIDFQRDKGGSPIPLENCPWCGTRFDKSSFQLVPTENAPRDLIVLCTNTKCPFIRENALPLVVVDEPIYRRLPCFLIATVDKFAAMPWTGQVGALFGGVDRHDKEGFYGPCDPGQGQALPARLPPPDLIIQDELHLISGPLGTMVGLYETALEALCIHEVDVAGRKVLAKPKIVASTATVRRAEKQIQALFNRRQVDVFPPPGPDRRDSFFAKTLPATVSNARRYLGVAAQGRSLKVVLLRVYLALLAAAEKCHLDASVKKGQASPADPYLTLLGYFNSLRELGGSRRIVEDEVRSRLLAYGTRKRHGEAEGPFAAREMKHDVVELTSRVSTSQVADARRRLGLPYSEKDTVDVALATNMISVGLDISRLGLMVVLGQPKTSAEYIQATSRVGRSVDRPGLIVTLLNIHRPRDRSHYERFTAYHETFYRSVEATSVTPFAPRALDRGLAGTLVGLARLGHAVMTPAKGAAEILRQRRFLDFVVEALRRRAREHDKDRPDVDALAEGVGLAAARRLDEWEKIAHELHNDGGTLQYQENEAGAAQPLLHQFLDPALQRLSEVYQRFRANRSLRDVEPSVNLWVKNLDGFVLENDR